MSISERLTKRFRNVPGVTSSDIDDWVAEAQEESGLKEGECGATDNALLYLAFSIGCRVIATEAARFFSYGDGDESVDKTNIYENYMRLSLDAYSRYNRYKNGGTSYTVALRRLDNR